MENVGKRGQTRALLKISANIFERYRRCNYCVYPYSALKTSIFNVSSLIIFQFIIQRRFKNLPSLKWWKKETILSRFSVEDRSLSFFVRFLPLSSDDLRKINISKFSSCAISITLSPSNIVDEDRSAKEAA